MSKIYAYLSIGFGIAVALGIAFVFVNNKAYDKGYKQAELVAAADANEKAKETNQKIADLQKQIKKLNEQLSVESKEFLKKDFPQDIRDAWDDKTLFIE